MLCTCLLKIIYLDHSGILIYFKTLIFGRVYSIGANGGKNKSLPIYIFQNTVSKFNYTINNKWMHTLSMILSQRSGNHTSKVASF